MKNIEINCQSSIKITTNNKIIYFDPFKIKSKYNDADIIFITHNHYDHFSPEDILKVKKDETIIVATKDLYENIIELKFNENKIVIVKPNENYNILSFRFNTIPAYNITKPYHPRKNGWVGYVIKIDNEDYYISGDTDMTNESKNVKCDVAFVPIGGTYTMDYKESANLINIIQPKIAIPIHYGDIVGKKEDAEKFKDLVNNQIRVEIIKK